MSPLTQAARACFGVDAWPPGQTIPQVSIEFEVKDADDVGLKVYLYGRAQSVMGGTSQIQKNIIASRILGLEV